MARRPPDRRGGHYSHGLAGRVVGGDDVLVLMRPGDALYVQVEGGYKSHNWALYADNTAPRVEEWHNWKLRACRENAEPFVAKGHAPVDHVPEEWIGDVVEVRQVRQTEGVGCGPSRVLAEIVATGTLTSEGIDLGWKVGDECVVPIKGDWVYRTQQRPPQFSDEDRRERREAKARAEALREELRSLTTDLWESSCARQVERLLDHPLSQTETCSLTAWCREAEKLVEDYHKVADSLRAKRRLVDTGEALQDFGGRYRPRGNAGLVDYWVLDANGAEVPPLLGDEKRWQYVEPSWLALKWKKDTSAEPHEFLVEKMPAALTTRQKLAAEGIADEIAARFLGRVEVVMPGWVLEEPEPEPEYIPATLSDLHAKWSR